MSKTRAGERFVVDASGQKTAVVVPIRQYKQPMEDMHDLAVIAERRGEKTISIDAMKQRMRKNGLI